jgi:hypothetical protein
MDAGALGEGPVEAHPLADADGTVSDHSVTIPS